MNDLCLRQFNTILNNVTMPNQSPHSLAEVCTVNIFLHPSRVLITASEKAHWPSEAYPNATIIICPCSIV